ncbi:MAG: DUF4214 domain-containing protein [Pseudomonas sp.]|uniref:DUF4214 domain-containing protein n=1 Tax=Pseudomonas sp. TaxID=306 RepID=UPI003D6ED12D
MSISTHIGDENVMATTSAQVQQLYVAYLGRAADKAGLDYWLNELNGDEPTLTLENLRSNFVNEQPEYTDAYAGLSRNDTVVKIYNNLFGRAPDAAGLAYWSTGGGASVNVDQLLTAFIAGASATDAKVIANKVLVSEVYTSTAGDNYAAADAKSIISGVNDTSASVTTAVGHLSDGTLSGIAVPEAVAALKVSFAANAAVNDFTSSSSKAADVLAIEKQLVTLTAANKVLADQTQTVKDDAGYVAISAELNGDLANARASLGNKTTLQLTGEEAVTAKALVDARSALTTSDNASIDKITAFEKATTDAAAITAPKGTDADLAVATLAAYGSQAGSADVWTKALADAGVDTATVTDVNDQAQALYDALANKATPAATVTKITADFSGVTQFSSVGSLAAQQLAYTKAQDTLTTASNALNTAEGNTYKSAFNAELTAKANLDASTSLDSLASSYKAITDAYQATLDAQTDANAKLAGFSTLHALGDNGTTLTASGAVTDKADVFYFATGKVTTSDGAVNLETGKDSLYLGDGYTLNTAATLDSTGIHGANNSALEVFFFKDATSGNVKAVIETAAEGNTTVTNNTLTASTADKVAIIELTGVTDVSQVTFANGAISHVA